MRRLKILLLCAALTFVGGCRALKVVGAVVLYGVVAAASASLEDECDCCHCSPCRCR